MNNYKTTLQQGWRLARFDQVLRRVERKIIIDDSSYYNCVGVRWYGMGAFIRANLLGMDITRKQQWVIKAGDVVYNKLFAWKNAFAIADDAVDNCIVSDKFPTYEINPHLIDLQFLHHYFRTGHIGQQAQALSKGGAALSKFTLNPPQFWELTLPLPPLEEQGRIVKRIEEFVTKIKEAQRLSDLTKSHIHSILLSQYTSIIENAKYLPMREVAPLERRRVEVELAQDYYELGIRSFGKGTFHKAPVTGASLGTKNIFRIEENDLLFNIVFAWEGAVAVARPEDHGRVGSHRFLTCVPKKELATSSFLCFHFLTEQGLQQLLDASPGSAGRNRTLGIKALEEIQVPIPPFEKQLWFDSLQAKLDLVRQSQEKTSKELNAMLPSILNKAFKGEL